MSESYTHSAEGLRQDCQLRDSSSDRGNLSNKWNINMKVIHLKMGIPHCITDQFCLIHTIFPEEWANDKANSISSTSEANCVKYTEEATNREYNKLVRGEFKILFSKINLLSPLLFISIYNSWCTTHKTAVYKDNSHVSKHTWECFKNVFLLLVGLWTMGVGVSLTPLSALGTLFLPLGCYIQPWYEGLRPALLYLVRSCSVDIPGKPARHPPLLKGSRGGVDLGERRGGRGTGRSGQRRKLQSGCNVWEENKRKKRFSY